MNSFRNIFENKEFKKRWNILLQKVEDYINDREYDIGDIDLENLVTWNDYGPKGLRIVIPGNECPEDLKEGILDLCKEVFPLDNEGNPKY